MLYDRQLSCFSSHFTQECYRSPVLSGLTRILECANQCGVAKLHVPILLIDEGWQQAVTNPAIMKRAEQVGASEHLTCF